MIARGYYFIDIIRENTVNQRFSSRCTGCQQITFVVLNRFSLLSNPLPPSSMFLMNNIKMDKIPTKMK